MAPLGAVTLAICRPGSVANSAFQGSCSKPLLCNNNVCQLWYSTKYSICFQHSQRPLDLETSCAPQVLSRDGRLLVKCYTPKQLFGGLHCLLTCVNIASGRRVNCSEAPNQTIGWAEPKIWMIALHLNLIWLNIIWSFPICHLGISEHLILPSLNAQILHSEWGCTNIKIYP